mmetsp:Transcript_21207/g.31603  ORF Transcript_21207/g.31603 Transcript_21207/m.31603 type:complete len:624 (+) Transcript_21207:133-2004(+)
MQGGEAQGSGRREGRARGPVENQHGSSNSSTARTRDRSACPLNKLSVRLLETYNNINQRYYAQKGLEAKKKKKRARNNSKEYDYQVVEGAYLGDSKRYRIEKEIGKGSFGKVVRAFDNVDKVWVAIKVVKKKKAFLRQAETEIKILKALQEPLQGGEPPKVVQLKQSFIHEKHQCIVFELLYGNLYELLIDTQYKGVSLNLVRKFGKQILQTLSYLKKRNVIHCDLKPENVLMRRKNSSQIKVIDFGSACFVSEKAFTYIQSRFYRAPEVLLGIEYSFPIDMWSLGCMLVEMHTGKPLFPGRNEQDQMCKLVEILGMPPDWLIESGKYGKRHFMKQRDDKGLVRWMSSAKPGKRSFSEIMKDARNLNTGKRGHSEVDYARFEDLLRRMLNYDFRQRITPESALQHNFFRSVADSCTSTDESYLNNSDRKASTKSRSLKPSTTISSSSQYAFDISSQASHQTRPIELLSTTNVSESRSKSKPSLMEIEKKDPGTSSSTSGVTKMELSEIDTKHTLTSDATTNTDSVHTSSTTYIVPSSLATSPLHYKNAYSNNFLHSSPGSISRSVQRNPVVVTQAAASTGRRSDPRKDGWPTIDCRASETVRKRNGSRLANRQDAKSTSPMCI